MPERDVAALYIRWTFLRAIFHRGWWLVTSLYLVVEAELTPFQLVFVGTAQNLTALVFEIPTGVMADTISRKWSVVVAHVLMGAAMLATGLVTSFPALVVTQMVWGLSWTFSSGADVAWLTDELEAPERVGGVLAAAARWEQVGAAAGLLGLGALAWGTDLSTTIVLAGVAMWLIGVGVAAVFPERHFRAAPREAGLKEAASIFRRGVALARADRVILVVFAATLLVNGAAEAYERLYPKQLLDLGLPTAPDPIVWLTLLGLVTLLVSVIALRIVESRIDGVGAPRWAYASACLLCAVGVGLLGVAPGPALGAAAVLLASGIGWTVMRCVSVIWVNQRATSDVRATVQSLLAQVEYTGEIAIGFSLAVLAESAGISGAMLVGAAVVALAGGLVIALPLYNPSSVGLPNSRSRND